MEKIIEKNKATMNLFVEFINTASEKLAEELISPNAIFYVPGQSEPIIFCDSNGIIMARGLRGEDLEKKLEEVIK